MKLEVTLIVSVFIIGNCQGQLITALETKTGTDDDAAMTLGNIDIDIFTRDPVSVCTIDNLDGAGNDFQNGHAKLGRAPKRGENRQRQA